MCLSHGALLVLFLAPLAGQADTRSVYEISYTLGQDAAPSLDAFSGSKLLRPGFQSEVQRGNQLNLGVRSTRLPSPGAPGLSGQSVQTSGGFIHRLGDMGFGYGVDLGLGMYSSTWDHAPIAGDDSLGNRSSYMISDLSAGPSFESGNLMSRVRVGVRYPVLGEADSTNAFYGHRGDAAQGAGYLSLDSRVRFSNQTEMSVSVFYDDYSTGSSLGWLSDRLDFRSGGGSSQSVLGLEMGLNF